VDGDSRESLKPGGGGGVGVLCARYLFHDTNTFLSSNDYIPFDSCSLSLPLSPIITISTGHHPVALSQGA